MIAAFLSGLLVMFTVGCKPRENKCVVKVFC